MIVEIITRFRNCFSKGPVMADPPKPMNATKRIIINVGCIVGLVGGMVAMNVMGQKGVLPGALFGGIGGGLGAALGFWVAALVVRDD